MTAQEAKEYGMVDEVLIKNKYGRLKRNKIGVVSVGVRKMKSDF